MNLKFWEWFKKKQEIEPHLDPTDAGVLKEYQDAIGIQRIPMQSIDRHDLTTSEVANPDLGKDDAENLKLKLKYGIHQSTMGGRPDTHTISGVRAISLGGKAEVIMKIDKSKLYELGYDITAENETFVKDLGLEPDQSFCRPPVVAPDLPEEEVLNLEHVQFNHYSGKPENRPLDMRPTALVREDGQVENPPVAVVYSIPRTVEEITVLALNMMKEAETHKDSCPMYDHYQNHFDKKTGDEFDCWHMCNCKGNHGDNQGDAVPV